MSLSNVNVNVTVNEEQPAPITMVHTTVEVAEISALVLPANANRKYLLLANNSDTDMFINLGGVAVVGGGIPINAKGNYEMPKEYVYTGEINVIHTSTGVKNLLVTEGV